MRLSEAIVKYYDKIVIIQSWLVKNKKWLGDFQEPTFEGDSICISEESNSIYGKYIYIPLSLFDIDDIHQPMLDLCSELEEKERIRKEIKDKEKEEAYKNAPMVISKKDYEEYLELKKKNNL